MIKDNIKNKIKYTILLSALIVLGIFLCKSLYGYASKFLFKETYLKNESINNSNNPIPDFNIPRDCYISDFTPTNYDSLDSVSKEMNSSKFWTSIYKDSTSLIMDYDKIKELNSEIIKKDLGVCDLKNYSIPSREDISKFITSYCLDLKKYYNDNKINYSSDDISSLVNNMNLDNIQSFESLAYGLTINKTNIRSYPTNDGAYRSSNSTDLDTFQQSSLEINEPVIILHTSLDEKWFFIQGYNYRGWCEASNIALANNKDELFDYLENSKFVMVTGNHINASSLNNSSNYSYNMGSKLFLYESNDLHETIDSNIYKENYIIKIPTKNDNNKLSFEVGKISFKEDTNYGYLPYNVENVLCQSLKSLGEKYDWGNKFSGRDCSGFVSSIYNTMGFRLPRDTGPMEKIPSYSLNLDSNKEKQIQNLLPGSLLFMDNHVMMYLGNYKDCNYMIHAFLSTGEGKKMNQVAVTPTNIAFNSSSTFLDKCTTALTLK